MDQIPTQFIPQRSRDAYATIRGFVYQVQLTIERWLELRADQHLELECGEDIDLVARALVDPEQEARLLEQVKYRSEPLTLRSREAIESLASAIEHITHNVGMNLVFRFTTNSTISIESPPLITGRNDLAGIVLWEQIRNNSIEPKLKTQALDTIYRVLRTANKPLSFNPSTWAKFQEYLLSSGTDGIEHLISIFEWSTGNLSASLSRDSIISSILRTEYAPSKAVAENIYQRLFLYVFTVLSHSERKILSYEHMTSQLSLPALAESESQLLRNVVLELVNLESRVDSLEASVKNTEKTVGELTSFIAKIVDQPDSAQRVVVSGIISIDPPPLSMHAIIRRKTVRTLESELVDHLWLALYGTIGMGKTHLASLISRSYGRSGLWVRLRGLTQEGAVQRLSNSLEQIGRPRGKDSFEKWYRDIFIDKKSNFLLVIDDLPRLVSEDSLVEHIVWLMRACAESNTKLITTSHYTIPARVRELVPEHTLRMLPCPPLLDEEARDLFLSFGASDEPITSGLASTINAVFKGHPALLAAQARHLKSLNWKLHSRSASDLFNGSFPPETHHQVFVQLMESIEDTESRELLYRLTLVRGSFGFNEISILSSVPREIDRTRERIYELMGLWIQEEQNDSFVLSPLLTGLGKDNIPSATRLEAYFRLGRSIVKKSVLRPEEILLGVYYLREANRALEASRFLLLILWHIHIAGDVPLDKFPVLDIVNLWSDTELPEQLEVKSQLLLRGLQALIGFKSGVPAIDEPRLIREVRILMDKYSQEEPLAIVGVASLLVPYALERNPMEGINFLRDALRAFPRAKASDDTVLEFPPESAIDQFVWVAGVYISTLAEFFAWIELLKLLSPEQLQQATKTERAERAFYLVPNRIWMKEADKKADQQNWPRVLYAAERLVSIAEELSIELLWALSIRAQMIILGEYVKDLAAVERIATSALRRPIDRRSKYIIQETLGRQYLYAKEIDKAKLSLLQALQDQAFGHAVDRIETLLCASQAVAKDEPDRSIQLILDAAQICQTMPDLPDTRCIEVQGELAIANWHNGNVTACYDALDLLYQQLYKNPPDSRKKKKLAVLLNHTVACVLGKVKVGGSMLVETPLPDGALARGLYLTHGDSIHENFNNQCEPNLIAMLSKLAALSNRKERAAELGLRGVTLARERGEKGALTILIHNALPDLISRGKFSEAISLAVEASSIMERESGSQTIRLEAFFLTAILPTISKIAYHWVDERRLAVKTLREVASILREVNWPDHGWISFMRLIEGFLNESLSVSGILAFGRSAVQADVRLSQHVAFVLATLHENMPPSDAVQAHLVVASHLANLATAAPFLWETTSEFIVAYWMRMFHELRAHFSAPRAVEQQLQDINLIAPDRRSKYVLQVISEGLRVVLDPGLRRWLEA